MELGVFMENNTIYRVKNINKILKNFSLTGEDKIFIVKNMHNSRYRLRFFLLECDKSLHLLVRTKSEKNIYKLKCPEISNIYIRDFILKDFISKTRYKIQENGLKKYMERKGIFISIIDIPSQSISVHTTRRGIYEAVLYIKNQEYTRQRITVYNKDANLAANNLIHIIHQMYDTYLDDELRSFKTKEKHMHAKTSKTMQEITGHSNLDTISKKYETISDSSNELDIEIET